MDTKEITEQIKSSKSWSYAIFFTLAIILGVVNGYFQTQVGNDVANFLTDIFIRLFKFVSVPIIGVTICLTIAQMNSSDSQKSLWKRTLTYTITTTIAAATVAAVLFYVIAPQNVSTVGASETISALEGKSGYLDYFVKIIPDNALAPFVQGSVLSILLIAIVCGFAIRAIPNLAQKDAVRNLLGGLQSVLFFIVRCKTKNS